MIVYVNDAKKHAETKNVRREKKKKQNNVGPVFIINIKKKAVAIFRITLVGRRQKTKPMFTHTHIFQIGVNLNKFSFGFFKKK